MSDTIKSPKLGWLMFFVIAAWVIFWIAAWLYFKDWNKSGVFGDSFGAINSLFSGLALSGIIYTIYLQREELSLQRKELSDTRKEFAIQNQTLKKQRFETTFFSLLSLHHSIVDKISIEISGSILKGGESLQHLRREFKEMYRLRQEELGNPLVNLTSIGPHRSTVMNVFTPFYNKNEEHFGQCFKNFVTLARFTKESDLISDKEKALYYEIIVTQIHACETILLFYYFQVGQGYYFKDLFVELKLSRTMIPDLLAHESHAYLFDPIETIEALLKGKAG
jgi:hypothetical protein